jgi:hypothetical protein
MMPAARGKSARLVTIARTKDSSTPERIHGSTHEPTKPPAGTPIMTVLLKPRRTPQVLQCQAVAATDLMAGERRKSQQFEQRALADLAGRAGGAASEVGLCLSIKRLSDWPRWDSNPHPQYWRGDFKSPASAIPPLARTLSDKSLWRDRWGRPCARTQIG